MLLTLLPFSFRSLIYEKSFILKMFKLFFIFYILIGLFCSFFNNVPIIASFVQAIFEMKLFIMIFAMLGINPKKWFQSTFEESLKFIAVINIPFVILQLTQPDLYDSIFEAGGHKGVFITEDSHIIRAAGIFWHQYQLAFFAAIASGYFILIKRKGIFSFWVVLNLILLFLSLQRQEIMSFIVSILFTNFIFIKEEYKIKKGIYVIKAILVMIVIVIFTLPFIEFFIKDSNLFDFKQSEDPRVVFYWKSFVLLFEYFPFGSGFGTFGGHSAHVFNPGIYKTLNFDNYIWYRQDQFMTDTYYPHVIAETGFVGVLFFILAFRALLKFIKIDKQNLSDNRSFGYFSLIFLLLVSLTSPNMNDVFCLFFTFSSFVFFNLQPTRSSKQKVFI